MFKVKVGVGCLNNSRLYFRHPLSLCAASVVRCAKVIRASKSFGASLLVTRLFSISSAASSFPVVSGISGPTLVRQRGGAESSQAGQKQRMPTSQTQRVEQLFVHTCDEKVQRIGDSCCVSTL